MKFPSPPTGNRARRAALAGALLATLGIGPARAEPGGSAVPAAEEAQAAFHAGVAAAREERWADAYEAFRRSHELAPRPVVLFNLAGAEVQTGRLLAAEASYRRFLDETEPAAGGPRAERRAAAEAVLEDLRERIPRVRLELRGLLPGDRLELDGRPLRWPEEQDQRVDPGAHRLRVLRAGAPIGQVEFLVEEFELRTVTWSAPPPAAPPAPVPAAVSAPAPAQTAPPRSAWRSPWLWTALGAAVAAAAGGAVLATRRRAPFVGNTEPGYVVVP